jgi:hypothetical protein
VAEHARQREGQPALGYRKISVAEAGGFDIDKHFVGLQVSQEDRLDDEFGTGGLNHGCFGDEWHVMAPGRWR